MIKYNSASTVKNIKMPLSLFPIACVRIVRQPLKHRMNVVSNILGARFVTHISLFTAVQTGVLQ